jgi:hypothetical protein
MNKTKSERRDQDSPRPSEDDIAQADLGGPRGAPELAPARMTPAQKKQTPDESDPGHTA